MNGGIKCIGAVDTSSDARYKTNVQPLAGALDNALRPRGELRLEACGVPNKRFRDRPQIGFIAEEVREILPDLVSEDHDGYLSIGYTAIIPVFADAVKELNNDKDAEIGKRRADNAALAQSYYSYYPCGYYPSYGYNYDY